MMENHGKYETHSVKLDELLENKLATFGSPGSAFSPSFSHPLATQLCCLTEDGSQCKRVAGNASYSKRIQKTVQQKKLRLSIDNSARHVYICDHHKNMIQSVRSCSVKRRRKDSADDENGNNSNDNYSFITSNDRDHPLIINPHDTSLTITTFNTSNSNNNSFNNNSNNINNHSVTNTNTFITSIEPKPISTPITTISVNNTGAKNIINSGHGVGIDDSITPSISVDDQIQVDLSTLQMNTLRRYKRHYRVQTPPGINKSQLAETLLNHFKTIPIDEKEAITYFIYMVKCNRNKIDQMKGLITSNHNLPYSGSSSPRHI